MRSFAVALAVVASVLSSFAQEPVKKTPGSSAAADAIGRTVNPEIIRAHVRFLSHDLLEGRGTGQRGGDIAAEYMATVFATYGLKPAGDNGTFMQKVAMIGISTRPQSKYVLATGANRLDLKMYDQYVTMDESGASESVVDAPIVWMGYGITAPEYNWDDYKDVDVKGKVLLMLVNEPPSHDPKFFNGRALTYYGRWTYKYEQAARMGAAGVILIHQTDMASYGWDVVRNSWGGERSYLRDTSDPKLKVASWIQYEIAKQVFADSGLDIAKEIQSAGNPGFKPRTLQAHLDAHIFSNVRRFDSNNVIAMLPGSDAKLKRQAVLYTAHYDHLGIDLSKTTGDNIYNGALDNATGCAVLLEMARAFSMATIKPKRSLIFAAVTGEEQGLLGSEYLGQHPPVPAKNIMLDLNYDDIPTLGIPEDVSVSGAERTSFYPAVQDLAKAFKLTIVPDARPEAGHYYRSDHFSLARVGIPAFSVGEGEKYAGHDRQWGLKQEREYLEKHYHQPSDEYHPDMDFSGNVVMARFGIALGLRAANQPAEIKWQPGDEFEKTRLASQK